MATDVMAEIAVDSTPADHAAPKRSTAHRVMSAVMSLVVLVLAAGFVIAAVAVTSGHWQASPVLSGSMEPTIPTGGVVFTERVPVEDLAVGDIVMYQRPDQPDHQVVHRIIELEPSEQGPQLRTQGDANATADPWQVRPVEATAHGRARIRPLRRVGGSRHPVSRRTAHAPRGRRTPHRGRRRPARLAIQARPGNGPPQSATPTTRPRRNPRRIPASSDPADDRRPADAPPTTQQEKNNHAVL